MTLWKTKAYDAQLPELGSYYRKLHFLGTSITNIIPSTAITTTPTSSEEALVACAPPLHPPVFSLRFPFVH
jgi:hypothetical protein